MIDHGKGREVAGASSSASPPLSPKIEGRKAPSSSPPLPSSRKRPSPRTRASASTPTSVAGSGAGANNSIDVGIEDRDDPLLSLFRVHNTKRVNFDLTPQPDEPSHEDGPNESSKDSGQPSGFLRKLVRSASRRRKDPSLTASVLLSKKGAADVAVEEDDIFVNKMLEPTQLRRVGSFLSGKHWSNILRSNSASDNPEGCGDVKSQGGSLQTSRSFSTIDGTTNGSGARTMSRESKESLAILLKKAKHAHKRSFRYRAAMKYYLLALKEMAAAGYTDSDPLMQKIVKSLNDVHHANSTVSNSANIVQIGIQHEDNDQLIKALKMYTIAYRMRRDSLGVDHPSLPVLLNMMGSVQVKRGEHDEAMRIYELSLRGRPDENGGSGRNKSAFRQQNPLTTAATLRDMAMILEHKSSEEKALRFYHSSLRYSVKYQNSAKKNTRTIDLARSDSIDYDSETGSAIGSDFSAKGSDISDFSNRDWLDKSSFVDESFSLEEVLIEKSTAIGKHEQPVKDVQATEEMELFIEKRFDKLLFDTAKSHTTKFYYDELFASEDDVGREGGEMDMAMTLHQIAQIHRRGHRHSAALSAYNASLRAMKRALGEGHGSTAAILGNIANLYTEMGDFDQAFKMYQEVLGIETMHFGLSHPEVAVTLHNIGTIECSRGRYKEGASLFTQVAEMQKIRYGDQHLTVAVTLACLADAHEKLGNTRSAIKSYEEALRIRISALGKSHLDVGRLTHKLARLASDRGDYRLAETYANRASETYKANKLQANHLFLIEMARDKADIQAGLVFSNYT